MDLCALKIQIITGIGSIIIIWLKKMTFWTQFWILRYTAAILDFQKQLQNGRHVKKYLERYTHTFKFKRLVVYYVITILWPNYESFWLPFWIFLYVTAILNFENDENVFFVPRNIKIDTSITIADSIQCHILIWSKSVILAAILKFWARGSHFGFWKLLQSICHVWKHINTHQNYQNRPQDTEKWISTPKMGAPPGKGTLGPFFQKTAGGIVFPGKFQCRNNFKHKVNTLSHPFVSERLTSYVYVFEQLLGLWLDLLLVEQLFDILLG